jgi:hypothetical protein
MNSRESWIVDRGSLNPLASDPDTFHPSSLFTPVLSFIRHPSSLLIHCQLLGQWLHPTRL